MRFEVKQQVFDCKPDGGVFDSATVAISDVRKVEKAVQRMGLGYEVKAANDGSVKFRANDLSLDTIIETQRHGEMELRDLIAHAAFVQTKHMRCQSPFRASTSFAAFVILDKQGRLFVHDSGDGITHHMPPTQPLGETIVPLFNVNDFRAGRYLSSPPPVRRWLIRNVIPLGIVGQLVAPGGTGKTMASLQLGVSVATGSPFAGLWEVDEAGAVLMLLGEDDDGELHRRIANISRQMTAHPEAISKLGQNLYIKSVIGEDNLMTCADPVSREVKHTQFTERLMQTAAQINDLKLIVIDPASRFRGGDENAAADTTRFVQALERLAQSTGATVLVIHHANKASMNGGGSNQAAARGSSALTDGVRLQINLSTLNDTTRKQHRIAEEDIRQYLTLSISKTNYSAPQADILLRRGEGGLLHRAESATKLKEPSKLDTEILKKVRAAAKAGKPHSKRSFCKEYAGLIGPFKMGEKALTAEINDMIEAGEIKLDEKRRLS